MRAFAEAGASHIAIIGRSQETLEEAKKQISNDFEKVKITTHACSASSETQMAEVAKSIGAWDVLVPNAGVAGNLKPLKDADISDWWNVFEVWHLRDCVASVMLTHSTRRMSRVLW